MKIIYVKGTMAPSAKTILLPVFLCLTFILNVRITAQKPISENWKPTINLQHPYLFFSASDVPKIQAQIESNKESKNIMEALKMSSNRLIYTPVGEPPEQSTNPRYDGDGKYNRWMSFNRHAMLELAFMYQMTGEQRYADKAFEFVEALCAEQLWNLKAHEFPIIYDRVWPWNALNNDDQVVFNYDIRTGDIATEMGITYDWLYQALSKAQRDRMRGALLEKAILLARNNYDYHWWATSYKCNWNTICFSGLGVSAMALLTEDPSLIDVVRETYQRMNLFLNELGDDGGWQEGRGYWAYGMRANIFFMEAMKRMSAGQYNLYEHSKLQDYPVDFALYGLTGYFGDGTGKVVGSTHLINKLTDETGNTDAAWYREHMMKEGKSLFDIIWPRSTIEAIEPKIASRHFSSIDWAFMRTDFKNTDNITVTCKAGYNDDPHHGHLDIGQFTVYWKGQYFITDLGHGKYFYDEKYFNEARWTYPPANSAGHNLVYVNGEQQLSAKLKNQPWLEGIGGKILDFRTSETMDYTLMDPSNAYPKKEMQKWRRHLILKKPDIVIVVDEVSSAIDAEIEARFHPGVKMSVKENIAILEGEANELMAIIPLNSSKMEAGQHAYLPVRKDAEMVWIPYVGSHFAASESTTIIGHVVLPVKNIEHALKIKGSLNHHRDSNDTHVISFHYNGEDYHFDFDSSADGIVLKK